MFGYRNTVLGVCYLGMCGFFAYLQPEQLPDMAATFTGLGLGTTGVVFGRGYNKAKESGG